MFYDRFEIAFGEHDIGEPESAEIYQHARGASLFNSRSQFNQSLNCAPPIITLQSMLVDPRPHFSSNALSVATKMCGLGKLCAKASAKRLLPDIAPPKK